jgi:hypothetical protein
LAGREPGLCGALIREVGGFDEAFRNMKKTINYEKPKDLNKFDSPQKAAELLRKVVECLETADPHKLVHIGMKIRIWG